MQLQASMVIFNVRQSIGFVMDSFNYFVIHCIFKPIFHLQFPQISFEQCLKPWQAEVK